MKRISLMLFACVIFFGILTVYAENKDLRPSDKLIQFCYSINNNEFSKSDLEKIRNIIDGKIGKKIFNVSDYRRAELKEIQKMISEYFDKQKKDYHIYSNDGIDIYYNGIFLFNKDLLIGIWVENNSDKEVIINFSEPTMNEKYMFDVSNNYIHVYPMRTFYTVPNYSLLISDDIAYQYGISMIYQLDFEVEIYDSEYKTIDAFPFRIRLNHEVKKE